MALGSNLGDRAAHLRGAIDALRVEPHVTNVSVSKVYETDPVGGPEQGRFLNAVVGIDTDRTPRQLLALCRRLEEAAARVRQQRWGPRTLDVDVLLVGDLRVDDHDLVVPHPRMWDRAFVLAPLSDLAPELVTVPESGWAGLVEIEVDFNVGVNE